MRLFQTMRDKLIVLALVPVLLMSIAAAFTAFTVNAALTGVGSLFEQNLFMKEMLSQTDVAKANLYAYMETKNSDNLRRFMHYSGLLSEKASRLDVGSAADEESLAERNISALLKEFIAAGDSAVKAKRGRAISDYQERYERAEELASFIRDRSDALSLYRLDAQLAAFSAFSARMHLVRLLNIASIASALVFGVAIILFFSIKVTDPIVHLGTEAEKIGRGVFDDFVVPVEAHDEIGAAARAFNLMKKSVKDSIDGIRAKAEVERELMAEHLKNLEMTGLLRNAELAALQSRINPHFLFNTLNAGIQLAVVEDAERTRTFLERLTRLMRYSLRDSEAPVALKEEAESISAYFYLMSIRFPGVYDFSIEVLPEASYAAVPKMIAQPLVENAIRHGLKDRTDGAKVSVRAVREAGEVRIEVEDNGCGISDGRAREIFDAAREGRDLKSSGGGGFGLANVIQRVRLFSGRDDVCRIERPEGGGTRITLTLPYREDI